MSDRILVTGGAGFIGSHLVDNLIREGHKVTVLDNFSSGLRQNLDDASRFGDVEILEGTILDEADVLRGLRDCGVVFHLAVQCVRRSLGRPLENHAVNATGTLNVLEGARRAGVSRFVYVSSSEVYGNGRDHILNEINSVCEPVTVYGGAKLAGEYYTKAYHKTYNMPITVVRPFNAYGPREHMAGDLAEVIPRFVIRIKNGLPPVIFGNGQNGRDFTFVTDVADGIARAASGSQALGQVLNIAFGRLVTIREVAETVAAVCGRPDLKPLHIGPRPGDVFQLHADIAKARDDLGFEAKIAFETGVRMYVDWFDKFCPDPSALVEDDVCNWKMPST